MRQVKWKQETSTKQQQTDKEREIISALAAMGYDYCSKHQTTYNVDKKTTKAASRRRHTYWTKKTYSAGHKPVLRMANSLNSVISCDIINSLVFLGRPKRTVFLFSKEEKAIQLPIVSVSLLWQMLLRWFLLACVVTPVFDT